MAEQDKTLHPLTDPDNRIQGSPSPNPKPTTHDDQEGALKTSEVRRGDTEGLDGRIQDSPSTTMSKQEGAPKSKEVGRDDTEDKQKSHEEQDSDASQGNNGGSSGDSNEKPPDPDNRIQGSPSPNPKPTTNDEQDGALKTSEVRRGDTEDKQKSHEEQDSNASQGNNGGSSGDSNEKPPDPDNRIQGSPSPDPKPTTNDEQDGALKTSEVRRGDTEDKQKKSHEEQDSTASQGNNGGISGDSNEKLPVKGRGERVFSPEREEGVRVHPLDLQSQFLMTHQKEGDEESGKNHKASGPTTDEEIVPTPTNSDRTAHPQDPSETEERDGKIAQTDQEESPSSSEIKEEKEVVASPNREGENKIVPENIGAGVLDRGEGRGEGEDFVIVSERKGGVTAIETEKRDEKTGKGAGLMAGAVAMVIFAILAYYILSSESPLEQKEVQRIDIFLRELGTVKTLFPNQRPELWRRSRIHLERHLQAAKPTEPVSLILTAGRRAERTLHCLAQRLASSFSTALNASVLHIEGASKAEQDSDQVKLDIDSQLQEAFEGNKPVAVIHRFEELPPGSTLIFYRYCDHENAAYKKTSLIFTVLLGEEEELPAQLGLSAVEEMVDDHLQRKFLSSGHPAAFDRMDLDKYSGLWSRISHLILPVAAEERIEHQGCL